MSDDSPCVGICILDNDVCIGCGRTSDEIYQAGIDASAVRLIYHVCQKAEWEAARAAGRYVGSSQDQADGFIHFSGPDQVVASVARHRAGQDGLVLIACDETKMAPGLKWEVSRGGALFPHHYGDLPLDSVISVSDLPLGTDGSHRFPNKL